MAHLPSAAAAAPSPRPAQASDANLALRAEAVTKTYGTGSSEVVALAGVSLNLLRGKFTAIMGPSGSGKSTLMHVMAGLETVSSGRIWLGASEITHLEDGDMTLLRRRHIGFVFQSFNLVPTLTVEANILLPFELDDRQPTGREREWMDDLVRSLGLAARLQHRPHELSGGEQQRVAICRALVMRPEVVFADEPTGNLDSRNGKEVLSLLARASAEYGQTIVMVTHDALAASRADEVYFIADGRVVDKREAASAEDISALMLGLERRA
jgi:putative ABC transport system ATP-binding protein